MKVYIVIKVSDRLLTAGQREIAFVYKNEETANAFVKMANKKDNLNHYHVEEEEVQE